MAMILENYAELLEATLGKIFDKTVKQQPDYVAQLFNVQTTDKYIERRQGMGEMGLMRKWKDTGRQVDYEDVEKGFPVTYTQEKWSKGFQVESDLIKFDRYSEIIKKPKKLARAVHNTKQYLGVGLFGNGFSAVTGPDSKPLFDTAHPDAPNSSTTYSNKVTYTLTADNLDTVITNAIEGWKDDKGNLILPNFDMLIVPRSLTKAARVITESEKVPDSGDNAINIYKGSMTVMEIPLLATWSKTAWFLVDSVRMKEYLNWLVAQDGALERDREDFNKETLNFKSVNWFTFGHDDWSFALGSTGTSATGA